MKLQMKPSTWIRLKTATLLGGVLVVALLTPHLVKGHMPLPESVSQSLVLLLDFLLAFIFFGIYYRDINEIKKMVTSSESRLSDSFRYIGKANVIMELIYEFMGSSFLVLGKPSDRQVLQGLVRKILVTVLKSSGGLFRVIDLNSLRSITEFSFPTTGLKKFMQLRNSVLRLEYEEEILKIEGNTILRSVLPNQNRACVLICRADCSKEDFRIATLLLNQIHLLLLISLRSSPSVS